MDSCFALVGAHQHVIAVGSMSRLIRVSETLYCRGECKHCFKGQLHREQVVAVNPAHCPDGYAMLMIPNKGETAVHGCHCPDDMVVRMRKVLAIPRSW